jgi:Tfp pilus assembly protein PilO
VLSPGAPNPLGGVSQPRDSKGALQGQYATLDITFSVSGTYSDFKMFLADIERSLVLMEVTKITFTKSEGDTMRFVMGVRLYSLNPPVSPAPSNAPAP